MGASVLLVSSTGVVPVDGANRIFRFRDKEGAVMCESSRWSDVVADARAWVADAVASGDLDVSDPDSVDRWVHETADGCAHVIYYSNAFGLWADGSCPVDEDDPVWFARSMSIGDALTRYAYRAVVHALESAISDTTGGVSA